MPLLAVNHHYYRETSTGKAIFPTTADHLLKEIRLLVSYGWHIGTQSDILDFICGHSVPSRKIAILTFDDGLAEQYNAHLLLQSLGYSALFFIPTLPIRSSIILDVHKLHMIRSSNDDQIIANDLDDKFGFSSFLFDEDTLKIQYRYDDLLAQKVKYFLNFTLSTEKKSAWLHQFFSQHIGDESSLSQKLYLSNTQLCDLANHHLIGSHAHTHTPLASLSSSNLASELDFSSQILSDITGKQPIGISYPFGGKSSVSPNVFSQAFESGYHYGFTMERGLNYEMSRSPLSLKRIDTNDLANFLAIKS